MMTDRALSLSTDLYELTMAAAFFENRMHEQKAIFELFVRSLPKRRSYLIAAGLEQALSYLRSLRFTTDQIEYLREQRSFKNVSQEFFDYLREFRFTGDVCAMAEGTLAFANQPLLRVTAPIIEAQIVETYLLATVNFQTLVASKAARVVAAARGRSVIEFGTRRAHGSEAGLIAARAAYIAGCDGTSNVEAGYLFGIPIFGTLAHSFIMSFEEEDDAFRAFLKVFPHTATVLVDTYDTLAAVERLSRDFGMPIPALRLDSGDLLEQSIKAREILDRYGLKDTKIFASSDLDEYKITELLKGGARIDSFGVGTQLSTSYDTPALGGVYKLVGQIRGGALSFKMKLSPYKVTYPGPKQVWRRMEAEKYAGDLIALEDEDAPQEDAASQASWRALISPVMRSGQPLEQAASASAGEDRATSLARLKQARERAATEMSRLPAELLDLDGAAPYPVAISDRLQREAEELRSQIIASQR